MSPAPVLLVGRWPDPERRRTGFPELRTLGFSRAIAAAGHPLAIAGLVPGDEVGARAADDPAGLVRVEEEGPGWLEQVAQVGGESAVVVAAGPYNAGRAAVLVAGQRPVWVDVPGDPFAEVQALALAEQRPCPDRQAAALAATLPALSRADAFGVVSSRQRLLLMGQLGLVGRLAHPEACDPVAVVPVGWPDAAGPLPAPARREPDAPLVLLLAGAFNTWLDVDTLIAGLDLAMQQGPTRLLVTGGAPAGHHDDAFTRFRAWAQRHADRVQLLGQLPQAGLAGAIADAHLGISLDRPGLEPETGSRTRVLFYLQQGLEVLSSTASELTADLAARGLLHPVATGDPAAFAAAIAAIRARGSDGGMAERARALLSRELSVPAIHQPVLDFLAAPHRLPPVQHAMADLATEHARLRDERTRLHATPTWRALSRVHRALLRGRGLLVEPEGD